MQNRIFFANDNGLLEYNGHKWNLHELPKKTIARSVAIDSSGRVYVGGQDEIGYFFPDSQGLFQYHDLKVFIPAEYKSFEDVWDLVENKGTVYARSIDRIYTFQEKEVHIYDPSQTISFLTLINDKVYFNKLNSGIYLFKDGKEKYLDQSDVFIGITIIDMAEFNGQLMVFTQNNGIYIYTDNGFKPWSFEVNRFVKEMKIFSVEAIDENQIAIGTELGGVIIVDKNGRANYILNKDTGLQNNTVASLFSDEKSNLWVGSYIGIDQVLIDDNKRFIFPDEDLEGAVYDIAVYNGKIYFGTNNGLYSCDWKSYYNPLDLKGFNLVSNSEGQVWGLDTLGNQLIMGHNRGAFIIDNNKAIQISPNPGYWKFVGIKNNSFMIGGSYEGLSLFKFQNKTWSYVKPLDGFSESSRIMEKENDNRIWVSHPYRGVYRIELSVDLENIQVRKYTTADGLPSLLRNHVFKIRDKLFLTGETNIYTYNLVDDHFELASELSDHLTPNTSVARLIEDQYERIWYITKNGFGYFKITNDILTKKISKTAYSGLADKFVAGFENIHISDQKNIYLLTDKGVIDYHLSDIADSNFLSANISRVQLISQQDSLLFGGYHVENDQITSHQSKNNIPELSYSQNALRFEFFSSAFDHEEEILFNPFLEKSDISSENWTSVNYKEYTNLSPGKYSFSVIAKNASGAESMASSFEFIILPPWYQTKTAYSIYGLLGFLFIAGLVLIPSSKYKKKVKVLAVAQEKSKEEIIHLKNEKLEADIHFKNQQLASSTMHIVQKNEVLTKVKDEVALLKKMITNPVAEKELKKLISLLSDDERLDEDWESFAYHFDQVHTDFLKRLKEGFSDLSPKDQKLSAYLRMNLSTKEIAPLLNISVRGVEISRYRLRKKLGLNSDVNLNEFMMNY